MVRKRLSALVAVVCLALSASVAWAADPEAKRGLELLAKGSYADAAAVLEKATSTEGKLALGRVYLRVGRYDEAKGLAQEIQKSASGRELSDAKVLEGEALLETGAYKDAEALFREVSTADIEHYRALMLYGIAQKWQGKKKDAEKTFYLLFDAYESKGPYKGKKAPKSAEFLTYVAIAAAQNEVWKSANSTFEDATDLDANYLDAWLYWGELFLKKYDAGEAEVNFDEVLKRDPSHPWAHVGKARVLMEQSADPIKPKAEIEDALKANPNFVPALLLKARLALDAEDYPGALSILEGVEKSNPNSLEMFALQGTAYYLTGELKKFEDRKKKALAINPLYAEFFAIVSNYAINQHLYEEVVTLCQEGLKIDKDYYPLSAILGQNYIRLAGTDKDGKEYETKGREALEKAYKRDKYEVRTINILNLYDKVIVPQYTFFDDAPFRFRVETPDQDIMKRYVSPFLKDAYRTYNKKYGISPSLVQVELFTNPDDYATRTVGQPGLSALGVCFGSVITAISPRNAQFHWGQVLFHELAHTFHISLSKSRVPRWFTEGLAVYETKLAKKEWSREEDRDLKALFDAGLLLGVADMNKGFTQAQSIKEILAAYYQSSLMVEYLDEQHGFGALVKMLKLFGEGKSTVPALQIATGLTPEAFDEGFKGWLKKRFAYLERDYIAPFPKYRAVRAEDYRKEADAKPTDAQAQLAAAFGFFNSGDLDLARPYLDKALALAPSQKDALYLDAQFALAEGDPTKSKTKLEAALKGGADGYDLRMDLGQLAKASRDVTGAKAHFEKAHAFDPTQVGALQQLAKLALDNKDDVAAVAYLKQILALDQNDATAATYLVEKSRALGKTKDVLEYAPVAIFIAPTVPNLHLWYAEALLSTKTPGDAKKALFEAESALSIQASSKPGEEDPAPLSPEEITSAHVLAAEAALLAGDKTAAKSHAQEALRTDPSNSRAQAVLSKS
jgi:Tfp pilus assembly protein PilF